MKPDRARRPGIEGLEVRWMPSAVPLAGPAAAARSLAVERAAPAPLGRAMPIRGKLAGRYAYQPGPFQIADGATIHSLSGKGRAGALGRVSLDGQVSTGGYQAVPVQDTALVTVRNARGSILIRLNRTSQAQPLSPAGTWEAAVIDGAGAYTNVRGIGTARLTWRPDPAEPCNAGPLGGRFELRLDLAPPRR